MNFKIEERLESRLVERLAKTLEVLLASQSALPMQDLWAA